MADSDIAVRVGADISSLKRELGKGSGLLKNFRSSVNSGAKAVAGIGLASATAGAAIATGLVKESLSAIDAQAKLAQQLKTTSKEVSVLTRAGELAGVSLNEITNASLKLEINAGKAEQGLTAQKRAFDAMGLSAKEVMKLPLSERMIAINEAIQENVAVTKQAAVASDIFGAKNASTIRLLDAETIRKATDEVTLFGSALTDVDAAKVEQANDSMSVIAVAVEGIIKQFTVQLAPILKAITDQFKDSAEEAGGMGTVVQDSFSKAISVAGFLADAVDGIDRAFSVTADGIIIAINEIIAGASSGLESLITNLNKLPLVDMTDSLEAVREFGALSGEVVKEARANIDETLMAPLPSESFKQWVEDAQQAGEAAAEATIAAREKIKESALVFDEEDAKRREDELVKAAEQEEKLSAIADKASKSRQRTAETEARSRKRALSGMMDDLSSLMDSGSRKQFEVGKKAALAQAAVSTITSAQESYKALAGIPVVGPTLGIAAASAAILAGNARMSAIKSQSFAGGGGGRSDPGGGSVSAAAPSQAISGPQESNQFVTLQGVDPGGLFTGQQILDLVNSATENGGTLRT
jgi:hypothetical protein